MPKRKILLVDDEKPFLITLANKIKSWNYEVVSASSGKEAIEVFKKQKVDIIVLDLMMPVMDGIATLKKIRKIDDKVPVIMFTAYPGMQAINNARELGVGTFIPKFNVFADAVKTLESAINMEKRKLDQKGT